MQAHYASTSIPWGHKSLARWAVAPSGTLLVFVHGFGGKSVGTWSAFNELLTERPAGRGVDIVFFGYDSLRRHITPCAVDLYEFLTALTKAPANEIDASLGEAGRRDKAFKYTKIVLVGHSAGAVVVRKALLYGHREKAPWPPLAHLLMFAPAHMGAHVLPMVQSALTLFKLAPVASIAKWRFPILDDLAEKSAALADLRKETEDAIKTGADYLRAKLIVLSEYDHVVNTNDFSAHDVVPKTVGKSHIRVCKPTDDYLMPLEEVARHL